MRFVFYVVALELAAVASASLTRNLKTRQALEPADVPSECVSACGPLYSQIQTCGTENAACLCTASVRSAGIACADCVAGVLPSTLQTLQSAADKSVETCQEEGHIIAPATIVPSGSSSPTSGSGPAAAAPSSSSPDPADSGSGSSSSSGNSGGSTSGSGSGSGVTGKSAAPGLSGQLQTFFIASSSIVAVVLLGFC